MARGRDWRKTTELGDGPRQKLIDMGVQDPGPLGGSAYTGPLVTDTLLFIGLRGTEAPDINFAAAPEDQQPDARLLALDKRTGAIVHSVALGVAPTGGPMTYVANGRQYIAFAHGTGSSSGLIALALEQP